MTNKTWIERIRGYDDLEARCKAAESMRDHNREMADAWKERAELFERYWNEETWLRKLEKSILSRRLKFSVGHNHIEIIIGNPVTVCENFNIETESEDGDNTETAYSVCSPKDVYDWKTGAIKALENLCHDWGYCRQLTGYLFAAMKKRYPEVFEK